MSPLDPAIGYNELTKSLSSTWKSTVDWSLGRRLKTFCKDSSRNESLDIFALLKHGFNSCLKYSHFAPSVVMNPRPQNVS